MMQLVNLTRASLALSATLSVALFLGACSSSPKIFVNEDPTADFSSYKTYSYESPLGTDDPSGVQSVVSGQLIMATDKQLKARGYVKSENNPDLTINFIIQTKEKIRTTSSPSAGGYYGRRGYGMYGGTDTTVTQYTEGTISIDVIDNTGPRKQMVWEGAATGKMSDKVRENYQEVIDAVVEDIFAKYPHYAAGTVVINKRKK